MYFAKENHHRKKYSYSRKGSYRRSKKGESKSNPKREWRKEVMNKTYNAFKKCSYSYDSFKVKLDEKLMYQASDETDMVELKETPKPLEKTEKLGSVTVINKECLDAGLEYKNMGFNPVVLNMASDIHPGGGYRTGAGAQEESLFRRTNLHMCLDGKQKKMFYPIPDGT